MSTPKETIYDDCISPLMDRVIALCKEHKINMVADFSLGFDEDEEEDLFCTTSLPVDKEDECGIERHARALKTFVPETPWFAVTVTSKGPQ